PAQILIVVEQSGNQQLGACIRHRASTQTSSRICSCSDMNRTRGVLDDAPSPSSGVQRRTLERDPRASAKEQGSRRDVYPESQDLQAIRPRLPLEQPRATRKDGYRRYEESPDRRERYSLHRERWLGTHGISRR